MNPTIQSALAQLLGPLEDLEVIEVRTLKELEHNESVRPQDDLDRHRLAGERMRLHTELLLVGIALGHIRSIVLTAAQVL